MGLGPSVVGMTERELWLLDTIPPKSGMTRSDVLLVEGFGVVVVYEGL